MPYSQITLSQFVSQIGDLMDDPTHVYWTVPEIQFATWEGMRVWGAETNYWRTRGVFSIKPSDPTPFHDLSIELPTLRTRTWTLGQMVQEIQYALLEAANGISGAGMSGQISIGSILTAIAVARNRFVLDACLPLSLNRAFSTPPPPDGLIGFPQSSVFVHRVSWVDIPSGTWTNLWRDDSWGIDKGKPLWPIEPSYPQVYSESDNSPLILQIVPPPINEGTLEALTVDSKILDITGADTTFNIPDEWIHAVKWSALSYILGGEGQIKDMLRASYAEKRYQQAITFTKDARSILRLASNIMPLNIDSLDSLDASSAYWRNQSGPPECAGVLYDMVAINPGIPDQLYSLAADVVQSAPLPGPDDFMQMGEEELDHLTDYVSHILTFKCGGNEFKGTFSGYDNFQEAVARRGSVNAAKIKYLTPAFGQPQSEWALRPDRLHSA